MRSVREMRATSDIMETLLALMVVSAGVLLLAVSLPDLMKAEAVPTDRAAKISSELSVGGILDLDLAERKAAAYDDVSVTLLTMENETIVLQEYSPPPGCEQHVHRTPVLVRMASVEFPAFLVVACAG